MLPVKNSVLGKVMFFPFFWNTWQLMLTRPYMCIHHNQSSQPEDGFSPLGHKVGTILHACNIILLLLVLLLLMMEMIMIAINVGLWKQFCSRLFDLLLQMLILSFGVFRSNAV